MGKKIVIDKLELAVQTSMRRVVGSNKVSYRLVDGRNANSASKGESVLQQETIAISRNKQSGSVFRKDNIAQLIKVHLKTQQEELTHLASTQLTTCIFCKEKEKFIDQLIKEN